MPEPSQRVDSVALVVVDMQEDYFDPALWPRSELPDRRAELVDGVRACLRAARRAGWPVVWVRQLFQPDLSDAFPHMRESGRRYAVRGTAGAAILSELESRPEDLFVAKTRYSAFFGTGLEARLRKAATRTVVLAGITTSWCIRSTATDAFQHGFRVVLVADAMAAFREADHQRDIAAMDGLIARVVHSRDLSGVSG